jgi:hypothetical protein
VVEPHPRTLGQRDGGIGQDAADEIGAPGCGEGGEPNDQPCGSCQLDDRYEHEDRYEGRRNSVGDSERTSQRLLSSVQHEHCTDAERLGRHDRCGRREDETDDQRDLREGEPTLVARSTHIKHEHLCDSKSGGEHPPVHVDPSDRGWNRVRRH